MPTKVRELSTEEESNVSSRTSEIRAWLMTVSMEDNRCRHKKSPPQDAAGSWNQVSRDERIKFPQPHRHHYESPEIDRSRN